MTGRRNRPHHGGNFQRYGARVIAAAEANPATRCWRCHLTRAEYITAGHTPAQAEWTRGHVNDGEVNGELRAEHAHCNYSAGAQLGNARRQPTSEDW